MTSLDEIAKVVDIFKPVIEPFVAAVIQPSIDKVTRWIKKENINDKVTDNFFENKFSEYLSITLNRCENVNVLIFQNQQIKIQDFYLPQTIVSNKNGSSYLMKGFNKKLFSSLKKVMVSDTAGMGKSTLSKWLCRAAIEEQAAIPVLIELRNLRGDHDILDEIFSQFNPIGQDFDKDLILKFIELGRFFIVMDGFDEIQLKSHDAIVKCLKDFIDKAGNNWFLLTSRPEGSLSAFGDFQSFNIQALDEDEVYELIKKYDSISPVKVADALKRDIEEKYENVGELLGNPFLVSLLYSTYIYNKDIPSGKVSFYEEIYSALFKRHDLSKDGWSRSKRSGLDIQQFRIILRQLAYDTALLGETSYSEISLIESVKECIKKSPGIDTNAADFVDDLVSAVPLFQRDGLKIKWAHKSLQDFFMSEYIVYDSRKELFLERIYERNTNKFNNVLDFIIESDYKSFRKTIVKKILEEFISHYENTYTEEIYKQYKTIDLRKSRTFATEYVFFKRGTRDGYYDIFKAIEERYPKLITGKKKTLHETGHSFQVATVSGLKTTLIGMLSDKNCDFLKDSFSGRDEQRVIKIKLDEDFNLLTDAPGSILNSKENFDKATFALPFTGDSSYVSFPIFDYLKAKSELESINQDITSDSKDIFAGL
jgi:hypothetical protein